MRDIRRHYVYPSNLDIPNAFSEMANYFKECGYKQSLGVCHNDGHYIEINASRSLQGRNFSDILKIFKEYPNPLSVHIHSHWKSKKIDFMWGIDFNQSGISFDIEAEELNFLEGVHEQSRHIFQAYLSEPEKSPYLSQMNLKKTIFLAHRFDEHANLTRDRLCVFLRRLGFDVKEGEGYEDRDIPKKVIDRICTQDIFLCLVTPGDTSWITSEVAFAKAHGKYIIFLCEEGTDFKKGIIGTDYEHITFSKTTVEKSFSELLYALPT